MAGNCLLIAPGYGARTIHVESLDHGMKIPALGESSARAYRTFFGQKVTTGSFTIGCWFTRHDEYEDFATWLQGYGERRSRAFDPTSPMAVIIPTRGFFKLGVPVDGITFGDNIRTVVHRMSISFKGTADPVDYKSSILSRYFAPQNTEDPESKYQFPAGATDLTTSEYAEEVIAQNAQQIQDFLQGVQELGDRVGAPADELYSDTSDWLW